MDDQSKTRDERIKELLDGSASDAVQGMKGPSLADSLQLKEPVKVDASDEAEDEGSGDKKIRIRKSRLTTLEKELEGLRQQVASSSSYQERVTALETQLAQSRKNEDDLPDWWKEAYGESEISKKGYADQQRVSREILTREFERREAQRAAEESERAARVQAIETSFDEQMDELEETIGRELTDTQKGELLDIVGEYSPMDGDKYVAYLPVSKAYELWSKDTSKSAAKREMAVIAGIQSSGGTIQPSSTERPQWGSWRQKYGL